MLCIDDVSGVTSTDISTDELSGLAEKSIIQKDVKRALVANEKLQHGLARVYMSHAEYVGHNFKLFDSVEKAKAWILSGN